MAHLSSTPNIFVSFGLMRLKTCSYTTSRYYYILVPFLWRKVMRKEKKKNGVCHFSVTQCCRAEFKIKLLNSSHFGLWHCAYLVTNILNEQPHWRTLWLTSIFANGNLQTSIFAIVTYNIVSYNAQAVGIRPTCQTPQQTSFLKFLSLLSLSGLLRSTQFDPSIVIGFKQQQ